MMAKCREGVFVDVYELQFLARALVLALRMKTEARSRRARGQL
jgi:hypothetical protein